MGKNSILEQALLQVTNLEEAVKQNAKGILASTMKQELNDLLKEEEEEEKFPGEDEDVTGDEPADDEASISDEKPEGMEGGFGGDDDDEEGLDGEEDLDGEDDLEGDEEGEDEDDLYDLDSEDDEEPEGLEGEEPDDTLDMTGAGDSEVLKVFQAMKGTDGIIVKKDGNNLELTVNDEDYIIKLNEEEWKSDSSDEDEFGGTKYDDNEETIYEIELDDEDDDTGAKGEYDESVSGKDPFTKGVNTSRNQKASLGGGKKEMGKGGAIGDKDPFDKGANTSRNQKASLGGGKKEMGKGGPIGDKDPFTKGANTSRNQKASLGSRPKEVAECDKGMAKEGEQTEAARTKWNIHGDKGGQNRAGIKSKKLFKAGSGSDSKSLNEQIETLKKQNAEYKKALILFKEKLNEVAVFNANLAYATRLFTEQTTTKQEKMAILKRFDSISTITEAKNLYGTIKAELDTKKPVNETVINKITSTSKTSSSTELLSESKSYEDPQFNRMKVLMGINKK